MAKLFFNRSIMTTIVGYLIATISIFISGSVFAHSGHDYVDSGQLSSFISGIAHPLTGLDHLVMLIGVGFIVSQYKKQSQQYRLVCTALISMLLGLGFGALSGFATGIETMILASVFVAAVAVYKKHQGKPALLSTVLSVVAVMMVMFHGWAHGLEVPAVSLIGFAPGILLSAGVLSVAGFRLGRFVAPKWQSSILAASGVLLVIAS